MAKLVLQKKYLRGKPKFAYIAEVKMVLTQQINDK